MTLLLHAPLPQHGSGSLSKLLKLMLHAVNYLLND